MTRQHDLKTIQPYFDDIAAGRKTFEMRINDRQFQPGDVVVLREFNPKGSCKNLHDKSGALVSDAPGPRCQYTGRSLTFRIGYVLSAAPGVPLGDYVVFSLHPINSTPEAPRALVDSGAITKTIGPPLMHMQAGPSGVTTVIRTMNTAGQPIGGDR